MNYKKNGQEQSKYDLYTNDTISKSTPEYERIESYLRQAKECFEICDFENLFEILSIISKFLQDNTIGLNETVLHISNFCMLMLKEKTRDEIIHLSMYILVQELQKLGPIADYLVNENCIDILFNGIDKFPFLLNFIIRLLSLIFENSNVAIFRYFNFQMFLKLFNLEMSQFDYDEVSVINQKISIFIIFKKAVMNLDIIQNDFLPSLITLMQNVIEQRLSYLFYLIAECIKYIVYFLNDDGIGMILDTQILNLFYDIFLELNNDNIPNNKLSGNDNMPYNNIINSNDNLLGNNEFVINDDIYDNNNIFNASDSDSNTISDDDNDKYDDDSICCFFNIITSLSKTSNKDLQNKILNTINPIIIFEFYNKLKTPTEEKMFFDAFFNLIQFKLDDMELIDILTQVDVILFYKNSFLNGDFDLKIKISLFVLMLLSHGTTEIIRRFFESDILLLILDIFECDLDSTIQKDLLNALHYSMNKINNNGIEKYEYFLQFEAKFAYVLEEIIKNKSLELQQDAYIIANQCFPDINISSNDG